MPAPLSTPPVPRGLVRRHREAGHWRDTTVLDDLRDQLDSAPDRTVLVDRSGPERDEVSVAELARRIQRCAEALRALGVGRGEAVGYQLGNRWETVALFHACARIGAVAVPLALSLGAAEVEHRLALTGAVAVIADGDEAARALAGVAPRLEALRTAHALDAPAGDLADLAAVLPDAPAADLATPDAAEAGPDDLAVVLFTSGTTGRSKAVLHTANTLWAATRGMLGGVLAGATARPRVLTPSVATHVIGIMTSALGPIVLGTSTVLTPAPPPEELLALLDDERVTHLLVGPTGLDSLLDALAPGRTPPRDLEVVALGGAPIAEPVLAKTDRLPVTYRTHWGMTEVPAGGVSSADDDARTSWHTLGHAPPGLERQLADVAGTVGEVVVRGPQVTVGVLRGEDGSPAWTPEADDGWFRTGDLAEVDAAGELAFVDRGSDKIKGASGMLIPTADVEDLIVSHPDVSEAVLVGHHPGDGQEEVPAAVVVPADGCHPELDAIRRHLLDRGTTDWYLPEHLVLVDALARDAQGKVDKRALRARLDG
ncbi:class I adenylate-forming enzyme family protein [Actinomycetospora aeridis]|uniref:Class I adenylate-forming enzyme family protein n=1 Tax=Actinomycetospora aeridis TaxID=3129231 RepID=A0ABU8N413_9PSEU